MLQERRQRRAERSAEKQRSRRRARDLQPAYRQEPRLNGRGRIVVGLLIGAITLGVGFLALRAVDRFAFGGGSSTPGVPVTVEIPEGLGTREIARILEDRGVVRRRCVCRCG